MNKLIEFCSMCNLAHHFIKDAKDSDKPLKSWELKAIRQHFKQHGFITELEFRRYFK